MNRHTEEVGLVSDGWVVRCTGKPVHTLESLVADDQQEVVVPVFVVELHEGCE